MNAEQKLLAAAMRDRQAFTAVSASLREGDFTESAGLVWGAVTDYYGRDADCRSVDPELLAGEVGRRVGTAKHRDQFVSLVRDLNHAEVSPQNVMHDFIAVRREAIADKLAATLLAGKDATDLVAEYQRWNEADAFLSEEEGPETYVAMSMHQIMETDNPDSLIKVWPKMLNERLDGGLLRGHHMVVFARPEMGKTLFLINAMVGFLKQDLKVLYIGNEEPLQMTAQRMISRCTGLDKASCHMDPDTAYEKALEVGYGNWVATKLTPGSIPEIERECERWEPDVLVVDQLRNLRMKEDNYVQKLEKAAAAVRQVGKKYDCLVLSATQAGDSATDKPVLEMGDVDSSNTGIPAQADVMVGISATQEDFQLDRRMVSLPKNKRSGNHTPFSVKLDLTRSRIISG